MSELWATTSKTASLRKGVGTHGYGNGAFRVFTYGQAGNAQSGGFFLETAGIRQHHARILPQMQKFHVRQWFGQMNAGGRSQAETLHVGSGPGMDGENKGKLSADIIQGGKNPAQSFGVVHIGWPVQRDHSIFSVAGLERRSGKCQTITLF